MTVLQEAGFAAAVIDALSSHICILDHDGVIVAVNRACENLAKQTPLARIAPTSEIVAAPAAMAHAGPRV